MNIMLLIMILLRLIHVLLIFISMFIIANTIKLTVHARRKEISIMKYVGATNSFIRWPFIVEGMIIGLFSGVISLGIVASLYIFIGQKTNMEMFLSRLGLSLLAFGDMFNLILVIFIPITTVKYTKANIQHLSGYAGDNTKE